MYKYINTKHNIYIYIYIYIYGRSSPLRKARHPKICAGQAPPIYIYIYIYRERERERYKHGLKLCNIVNVKQF